VIREILPGMDLRRRVMSGMARQLGEPQGWRGRLVGRGLNRGNREMVRAAVHAADVHAGDSVADLGFGGGLGLELLLDAVGPRGHVHGLDISTTMLEAATRRYQRERVEGRLTLLEATMVELPIPNGALDAAITVNTVYFIEDLGAAFAEMARVLRSGGRAVVGIGDPQGMAAMPVTAHGFRLRPVEELTRALEDSGLQVVAHDRVGSGQRRAHLLVGRAS
jgi:arsenite methyltransferase